jgi:hypothetical protein
MPTKPIARISAIVDSPPDEQGTVGTEFHEIGALWRTKKGNLSGRITTVPPQWLATGMHWQIVVTFSDDKEAEAQPQEQGQRRRR